MEEDKNKLDKLNEKLYSRTKYREPSNKRSPVKSFDSSSVEEKWQTPDLDEMLKHEIAGAKPHPFVKKIFIFALIFFIAAVGVASFVFFGKSTFISSKNVDINVLGPATVLAGGVLELGVGITNTNNADLEFAELTVQHPSGSRNPENTVEALTYTRDNLGVIKSGGETVRNIRTVLLGSPGETKEIKFSVEYKVKGSNATFHKDKIFEITIGETPVTLVIESPESATSGEEFSTTVTINMRSGEVLRNAVLKVEYPYGYNTTSATPSAVMDNNLWSLGDLAPGDEKKITIKGRIVGEDQEERTFRFYVGVADGSGTNYNPRVIVTSAFNTVGIERQPIGLEVTFNGDNVSTYIAPAARPVALAIKYTNNLPYKIFNPRLEVVISGTALDKSSVVVGNNGTYDQTRSRVSWDLRNSSGQPELGPGEKGSVSLRLASLTGVLLPASARDIRLDLAISGVPLTGVGQETLVIKETRNVKISSQVNFTSKILYSLGSFANRGPIPPKVGEETTYTVVFSVGNTQGDINNAKITASLGPGVRWLGASSFESEDISYDEASNLVTWDMERLLSDTGFASASREISFQIALTPSLSQVGTAPNLVTGIVFTGRDNASDSPVAVTNPPLTTRLSNDPVFIQGDDIVVK